MGWTRHIATNPMSFNLTVRMLFKERLYQHTRYEVVFARRGKSRTARGRCKHSLEPRGSVSWRA